MTLSESDEFYNEVCSGLRAVLGVMGLPPLSEHGPGCQGVINALKAAEITARELKEHHEQSRQIKAAGTFTVRQL